MVCSLLFQNLIKVEAQTCKSSPLRLPSNPQNDWLVKIDWYALTKWKIITTSGEIVEGVWKRHEKRDLLSKHVLWQRLNWCAVSHRQKVTGIIILLIGNLGPEWRTKFLWNSFWFNSNPGALQKEISCMRNHDRNNLDGCLILSWNFRKNLWTSITEMWVHSSRGSLSFSHFDRFKCTKTASAAASAGKY